jgi:DNA-binding transcriptional LysR family regulator
MRTSEIVRAVLDGRADAGIARTPVSAEGVRLRTVRLARQGVLVPAGHPLARGAEVWPRWPNPILMHPRAATPPTTTSFSPCSAERGSSQSSSRALSCSIRPSG